MLITGIILAPAAMATPAVHDLADLQSVIDAAASSIGDPNNPNRGFGFNLLGGSGQMGTADLVNNITNSILRGKVSIRYKQGMVSNLSPILLSLSVLNFFNIHTNMNEQQTTWLDLPSLPLRQ
ncbi:hypothetical protein A1F94_001563 [Pyrenophora tritici-repentis]|nr:hypothetical protein A1F94_001563 [Pyrenophora tritici-repentis]